MLRYYITDRSALGGEDELIRRVSDLGNRIDIVQVRERDLSAKRLAELVSRVLRAAHPDVRVLVNDRADIAIACGSHGVHLRGNGPAPLLLRRLSPSPLISVSCHSVKDVRRANAERADLALLAPIFETPGKSSALGLDVLREAVRVSSIPVIALGGVLPESIESCRNAGAAGFAGIRIFQETSVSGACS